MRWGEDVIDRIYEAAALPDRWPALLDHLSRSLGAAGGILLSIADGAERRLTSEPIVTLVDDFFRAGWGERNHRIQRYMERAPRGGFLADADINSLDELRSVPVYADFLAPRRADAGVATTVEGWGGDNILFTFEGFRDHATARDAIRPLTEIQAHLARAVRLSSRLRLASHEGAVAALEGLGLPAATLDAQGRLLTVNAGFEKRLGTIFEQGPRRLHMCEKASDLLLSAAFQQLRLTNSGTAIPTGRAGEGALHLLPIRGEALDLFSRAASLALLVEPREQPLPSVELLTIVFGLTRGEAETARAIASGASIATVAAGRGVSPETIRSQLKSVFQKTYTNRQSELAALLNRLGGTAKPLAI